MFAGRPATAIIYAMNRPRHTGFLVPLLVSALVSLQWFTPHMHLVAQHDHDGMLHEHGARIHAAHNFSAATHHVDAIDIATDNNAGDTHQNDTHQNIVELDQECGNRMQHTGKATQYALPSSAPALNIASATMARDKIPHHDPVIDNPAHSLVRSRAPPEISLV